MWSYKSPVILGFHYICPTLSENSKTKHDNKKGTGLVCLTMNNRKVLLTRKLCDIFIILTAVFI